MQRLLILFIFVLKTSFCFAASFMEAKKQYANMFYDAFVLQSNGHSTQAFYQFKAAFQAGTDRGESPKKLQAVADLFYWYRKYASHYKLYTRKLAENERIKDEYKEEKRSVLSYALFGNGYESEYGNNPRQAMLVRDFLLSVGEIVGGVFGVCVGAGPIKVAGAWMISDGISRFITTCNGMYYEYECGLVEFKKIGERAKSAAEK